MKQAEKREGKEIKTSTKPFEELQTGKRLEINTETWRGLAGLQI